MAFDEDLKRVLAQMEAVRRGLLAMVEPLSGDGLSQSHAGGWTVRRILQHVIESEATYGKLLAHQCGRQAPSIDTREPTGGSGAATKLRETRAAALAMIDGVDEATLYRLVQFGHEEYSVLSVLENIASHDGDHIGQIGALIAPQKSPAEKQTATADIVIRPASPDDLPRLTEIYNHYVTGTPTTFDLDPFTIDPFTIDQRRAWFDRYATAGRYRLLVAEENGAVRGYTSSSQFHPRRAYDATVETTILCAPDEVGRGIGTLLYAALFEALRAEDVHLAIAAVTLPNDASCAIHERFGFSRVGVLSEAGTKFGRYWDVAWFQKRL